MEHNSTKPKLLFFQYSYDECLPAFVLAHMREHVQCLSQFFSVTVVNEDCDYSQMCDKYEPDLTLVEGSFTVSHCHRPRVTNTRSYSQIPKLGFLHSDAFSQGRAGFISDMDHWDIDTFFTISTAAAEHTPAIADRLFVWPNFVDPTIFRDYQQWKSIPVLFTGNASNLYPWRQNIIKVVSKHYPSLICPHPGRYEPQYGQLQVLAGEPYARTLNASWFVPTCGTVARDVVRKHFEVPACKACLITERSASLEAAGFVDMKNCVFGDEKDVLDKLSYLFQYRDKLDAIINRGHELVQSRHTIRQRDQILQWLTLRRRLQPEQRIVQPNPFEPMRIVNTSGTSFKSHLVSNGVHLALLQLGDEKLAAGRYEEAKNAYSKCLSYIPWMPEPQFRLGLWNLYTGNAKKAESWILEPLQFTLAEYRAVDPDPVEWAYFIVSLLCQGKVEEATKRSAEFVWLTHPELDRVRWAAQFLGEQVFTMPSGLEEPRKTRPSVHRLSSRSFRDWIQQICGMLRACGQSGLADKLMLCQTRQASRLAEEQSSVAVSTAMAADAKPQLAERRLTTAQCGFREAKSVGMIKRRLLYAKAKVAVRQGLVARIHRVEARLGTFLPYRFSGRRQDVFFSAIEELGRTEQIQTALVIGAALGEACTEALLTGVMANENSPAIFCIADSTRRKIGRQRSQAGNVIAEWYELSSPSAVGRERELEATIKRIKDNNQIDFFDLVLVDGSEVENEEGIDQVLAEELQGARLVLLDDICGWNCENHWCLLKDKQFILTTHSPSLRNGYSIFAKLRSSTNSKPKDISCSPALVG